MALECCSHVNSLIGFLNARIEPRISQSLDSGFKRELALEDVMRCFDPAKLWWRESHYDAVDRLRRDRCRQSRRLRGGAGASHGHDNDCPRGRLDHVLPPGRVETCSG